MSAIKPAVSPEKGYQVVTVEKTDPPEGAISGSWYRYVIELDGQTIVSSRRGTLKQVTEYAKECAENMSNRFSRGRSHWSSRNAKK
jgi:hypothetical protein